MSDFFPKLFKSLGSSFLFDMKKKDYPYLQMIIFSTGSKGIHYLFHLHINILITVIYRKIPIFRDITLCLDIF